MSDKVIMINENFINIGSTYANNDNLIQIIQIENHLLRKIIQEKEWKFKLFTENKQLLKYEIYNLWSELGTNSAYKKTQVVQNAVSILKE